MKGGDIYCLWEFKNGQFADAEAMQQMLDGDMGPGFGMDLMNNNMYPLMGNPLTHGKSKFTDAGADDSVGPANSYGKPTGSSFFIVEHHHKHKASSESWWGALDMAGLPE